VETSFDSDCKMAEFGGALSTALTSQSEAKPSIFEVLAQEHLSSAIRPAIEHVVKVNLLIIPVFKLFISKVVLVR